MTTRHLIRVTRSYGFFSDFLTALNGILYCHDQGVEPYVDWRNGLYSDSDCNLFDRYFHQDDSGEPFATIYDNTTPYGFFFPQYSGLSDQEIYDFLKRPAQVLAQRRVFDSPTFHAIPKDYFAGKRVLGFHKRGTDHGYHGPVISDEQWAGEVADALERDKFDKVFVITDSDVSLEFFKQRFGDMLLHTDSFRSPNEQAVHYGAASSRGYSKFKLAEEVIRDAVLLSMTDYMLLSRSNVATFTLLYGMQDESFTPARFHYIDRHLNYHN